MRGSLKWYLKAAKLGNLEAQMEVACRYSMGCGVELSIPKTIKWYRRAVFQGSDRAKSLLGFYSS
jgi:TPR repeat protein